MAIIPRIVLLALLFTLELLCASVAFDGATLRGRTGPITLALRLGGAFGVRLVVCFAAMLATFTYLDRKALLAKFSDSIRDERFSLRAAFVHLMALGCLAVWGRQLYGHSEATELLALGTVLAGIAAIVTGALAVLPWRQWVRFASIPGAIWLYAAGGAGLLIGTTTLVRRLWSPAASLTFSLVKALLTPFVKITMADPVTLDIGTARFGVNIAPQCSGLEGISLLLLFGSLWLFLFRRECRFPQALLLLPIGAGILFLLNSVRVAALILIGHAGAPAIALGGFHSQAGWLTFNGVSLGLCVVARRLPWFTTWKATEASMTEGESAATLPYLLPLLSILAAGMISHAVSGEFEWLYGLRLLAPVAVCAVYRREYAAMDWRGSWMAIAAGAGVILLWVGLDFVFGTGTPATMPEALRGASSGMRIGWIAIRVLSACVTVPFAEELAFRGFLLRRFQSREFDTLPDTSYTWLGVLASSAIFGALHGPRWPAGVLAGGIFAWVYLRRGRIGEAVVAHATANALLAAGVVLFGAWQYW